MLLYTNLLLCYKEPAFPNALNLFLKAEGQIWPAITGEQPL